jgi:flagellin
MVINTNMGAMNANRILDQNSRDQAVTMERLTTGLRVNRSADDAAGLAVVTTMKTQSIGTVMAVRNANDGMSMIQTVEGATEEVVNMMQRMRELAVQSMNDTYTNENRQQSQMEFRQLQLEIDRVADTTKFNGMRLMSNSTTGTTAVNEFNMLTTADVHTAAGSGFQSAQLRASAAGFQVGWETGSVNRIGVALMDFKTMSSRSTGIRLMSAGVGNVSNIAFAASAIRAIDGDLSAIKNLRAHWGAVQNRLDHTVSNLQNVNENINSSRSRIEDTDFAKESANLARNQVLQQAGMSMLSQANQNSQGVLSLLR